MEGLNKLVELEYLNMAVNSVSKIEGLKRCESLNKLDLTLNFIDVEDLKESLENLEWCPNFTELYLTGNPCTDWPNYRQYTIAKVETAAAVQNIEEIIQEADVVMIARGDLAIETPPESVPVMQRKIIGLGQYYHTPTIVATQMMASMTESPEPTRAEVSDIATAVLVGADCVMLSDETASGKYPIEAVKIMKRVIR